MKEFIDSKIGLIKAFTNSKAGSLLMDFFKSARRGKEDLLIKSIASVAEIINKKREGTTIDAEVINDTVQYVDESYTKAKIYYQVTEEIIEKAEALEQLIDRKTAQLAQLAEKVIVENAKNIGEIIGEKVGNLFSKAAAEKGKVIGGHLAELVGPLVASKIKEGIQLVGNYAKQAVSFFANGVKMFSKLFQ